MKTKIIQSIFYGIIIITTGRTCCMNRIASLQELLPFAKEVKQISDSITEIIFQEKTPATHIVALQNELLHLQTINRNEPRYNIKIELENKNTTAKSLQIERISPKTTYARSKL